MSSEPTVADNLEPETPAASDLATDLPTDAPIVVNPDGTPMPPTGGGSYTKYAMRNMVRKPRQSLIEYGLTVVGVLALLIGLSYLTR